jgi:chemotaxis protein MotA
MILILGLVIVIGAMLGGFMIAGGKPLALVHVSEIVTIVGISLGALIAGNPISLIKKIIGSLGTMLKGASTSKKDYLEMMQMLYELFQFAKKEGLIALEPHVESPETSAIISKYPSFLKKHHAVEFMSDTLKVILSGGIPAHDLEELMDMDLEGHHEDEHKVVSALQTVGDALPGIGIVAAVLGIIITMGKINEGAEAIGYSVASALTGTFMGVLFSYGFVQPMARTLELTYAIDSKYQESLKQALLSFAKGLPASVAIEYARRAIDPATRPSFKESEEAVKAAGQSNG